MKTEKGKVGYIKKQKTKYLIITLCEFSVVAALLIIGYITTGSRLNVLTIVAILGCLPAAKMLVEFIVMAPYKSMDAKRAKEIDLLTPYITVIYDMIITSEKVMPVDVIAISDHTVCGFTSSKKTDEKAVAEHLKKILGQHKINKVTVKIFHDYKAFLSRAEGLNNMRSIDKEEAPGPENEIRKAILGTSM